LVLLVPLFVFYLLRFYKSKGIFALFAPSSGGNGRLGARYFFTCFFFMVFLACLFFALAGPYWGSRTVTEYRRGADIVFALDLSRSMEIRDGSPPPEDLSRLERACRIAASLVTDLGTGIPGENRFGLAMGKGRGILALPLSYDTEAVLALLEGLGDTAVTGRGTNLESLVDTAAGAFLNTLPSRRIILLFSDGEELSGSFSAAFERAAGSDITVSALGLGTESGGPVPPGKTPAGSEGEVPLDERGFPLISFRRTAALRTAAEHTGGIYLDGNREDAVSLLEEHIRSLSSGTWRGASRREPRPGWRLFVFLGLLSLALSRLAGLRGRSSGHPGRESNG
jgi:Ca-activated chloride channel family protein